MATKMVRVSQETWLTLQELSRQQGQPMQKILSRAVEAHRRQYVLEKTNEAYAALREDPESWQEEQVERRVWEATLSDDLGEP